MQRGSLDACNRSSVHAKRSIQINTNMETTEDQNCGCVENGQDDSSYSEKQFVMPSKKRSANFFFEEGGSFPKYRKLTEEQIIATMKEGKAAPYAVSTSDVSSDEFSNFEENNNGEKDTSDSALNESSEDDQCQKYLDSVSESDGSANISPQLDLPILDNVENLIKGKSNLMQTTEKLHTSIIHKSQYSYNNESDNNNTGIQALSNALQQNNSQISATLDYVKDETHQGINCKEISNISANDKITPGTSKTIDVQSFSSKYMEGNNIGGLLSNQQFRIIAETSDTTSNIVMKPNDAVRNEFSMQSEVALENANDMNNTLTPNYIEENGLSDKTSHLYSSESLQEISNSKNSTAEQNINSQTNEASLDLNLIQLVLSLKQDIQKLAILMGRQESILNTVLNLNEISVAPLFCPSFPEKYNLKVPFNTIEEFDKFNQDLARDEKFRNEFITSLCSYIDNKVTLAKNIMTMMKNYMSKDLVTLYTASKATANKMVLKDTLFAKCLLQTTRMTIRNGLLPLEHEKLFTKSLGVVVSGAKAWHGHEEDKK